MKTAQYAVADPGFPRPGFGGVGVPIPKLSGFNLLFGKISRKLLKRGKSGRRGTMRPPDSPLRSTYDYQHMKLFIGFQVAVVDVFRPRGGEAGQPVDPGPKAVHETGPAGSRAGRAVVPCPGA